MNPVRLLAGLTLPLACAPAMAGFVEDSHAKIELRNHYINRDFRQDNAPQAKAEEWAQGFTAKLESGFTDGTLGFGVDAMGQLGIKLDSSRDRRGTGLLPYGRNSLEPADDYSELALTAKVRLSKSVLRLGTLQPLLPVVTYNDTRLLASTFKGGLLTSQELDGLTLNGGRLTKANLRDSSSNDDIGYGAASSDHFDFGGGTYAFNPQLAVTYYYAKLEEIYRQQFVGLVHTQPLGEGLSLRSDLRYFDSRGDGAERAGRIDNRNFNGMFTLAVGAHKFSGTFQQMSGDSAFPFLNGGDPYTVNLVTFNTFTRAGLDSWQARYDYDFAALGVPGLTFMTRYTDGRHAKAAGIDNGRERERDTDLAYVIQSGPLKNVSLRWRNVTFRSGNGLTNALDENRLIVGYTLALW
ncbi:MULTISPECIES: OprD family porin [unclassified Pseudomonas]|uniref:OprD family porin n=1 Tax=unclassified Pseudomonas TaxID=196821 RepID=UPI0021CA6BB4|nr:MULTISPECIES: OprD family porin [unclassified Pseudomonas]MCU1733106.1 OprD family porin [Pseudomonas sp. 20P_3.2_Bac4]MCU1744207.1 OprD family porin [Pseudomonas sp. 20P_3.2_Bac5]